MRGERVKKTGSGGNLVTTKSKNKENGEDTSGTRNFLGAHPKQEAGKFEFISGVVMWSLRLV